MNKKNTNQLSVFTATTTTKQLFQEDSKRKAFLIYNNGANIVEFVDTEKGTYGYGMPLNPKAYMYDDHFNPQGQLYVVATTGNTELRIWEIISTERV